MIHKIILISISMLVLVFLLSLKYCSGKLEGFPSFSRSIEESKERGVFLFEYKVINNPLIIKNRNYKIKSVWIENTWSYGKLWAQTEEILKDRYNYCFEFEDKNAHEYFYNQDWTIGNDTTMGFGCQDLVDPVLAAKLEKKIPNGYQKLIIYNNSYPISNGVFPDSIGYLELIRK